MSIEFLGHKESLLPFIMGTIERQTGEPCDVLDLFCGTGAVSAELKRRGYQVTANDNLTWCSTFAEAILFNDTEPSFEGVAARCDIGNARAPTSKPYDDVLAYLNDLSPVEGFFWRNYSPASERFGGGERMYFTETNAGRIDAIRRNLREWVGLLTVAERSLLLADLVRAANAVSNIAGTYGCYLKSWKRRALQQLKMKRSNLVAGAARGHRVFCADANELAADIEATIVYADPPYTKRQYAAYYHILETIVVGDEPAIMGSTGLRPWEDKASDYCYKSRALGALTDLVSNLTCRHFFMSYNEDGQMKHKAIIDVLSRFGRVQVFEVPHRRYKSSARPHKGADVVERLYHLSL